MLCSLNDVLKIKSVYKHVRGRWTTSKFHLRELLQLKSYIYFFPAFRIFEAESFLGFSLYVSITPDIKQATLCFKDINFTKNTIPPVFNITCPVHGQYVIYRNERREDVRYPSDYSSYASNNLCEVEVYGEFNLNNYNCFRIIKKNMFCKYVLWLFSRNFILLGFKVKMKAYFEIFFKIKLLK